MSPVSVEHDKPFYCQCVNISPPNTWLLSLPETKLQWGGGETPPAPESHTMDPKFQIKELHKKLLYNHGKITVYRNILPHHLVNEFLDAVYRMVLWTGAELICCCCCLVLFCSEVHRLTWESDCKNINLSYFISVYSLWDWSTTNTLISSSQAGQPPACTFC